MSQPAAGAVERPLVIGKYALFDAIASGGMATVHFARLLGADGFARTVAVKRLHAHYTTDPEFVTMFMDEARIVARIRHPNVVPMVDIIESGDGLFLVMEYVHGEALSRLLRTCRASREQVPVRLASAIMHGALLGLHAAHETRDASGALLDIVHRDVSPQNIIVGVDGVARVLDFGVAKAAGRAQITREGQIKGKLAYMSPEQLRGEVDRRADVFGAAVVLWEALTGRRLHEGSTDVEIVSRVVDGTFPPPSNFRPDIGPELDEIVMRGLHADPAQRYRTAHEMATDLERKIGLALPAEVSQWVERLARPVLQLRAGKVADMERRSSQLFASGSNPPPSASPASVETVSEAKGYRQPSDAGVRSSHGFATTETGISKEHRASPAALDRAGLVPIVFLSFCGALTVIGVVLGGVGLWARHAASKDDSSVWAVAPPGDPVNSLAPASSASTDAAAPPSPR